MSMLEVDGTIKVKKRIVSDSRRIYSLFRKLDVIKSRTFSCGDGKFL